MTSKKIVALSRINAGDLEIGDSVLAGSYLQGCYVPSRLFARAGQVVRDLSPSLQVFNGKSLPHNVFECVRTGEHSMQLGDLYELPPLDTYRYPKGCTMIGSSVLAVNPITNQWERAKMVTPKTVSFADQWEYQMNALGCYDRIDPDVDLVLDGSDYVVKFHYPLIGYEHRPSSEFYASGLKGLVSLTTSEFEA